MKFALSTDKAGKFRCDLLAIPVHEDALTEGSAVKELDEGLDGLLGRLVEEERFKGKMLQTLSVHTHGRVGPQRILLIGAGRKNQQKPSDLRNLGAVATRAAVQAGARTLGLWIADGNATRVALQRAVEGVALGRYRFDRYQAEEGRLPDRLESATFVCTTDPGAEVVEEAARRGQAVAQGVARARDLINEPAGVMTPRRMADEAEKIAKAHGLALEVMGPDQCRELGMGMYLAVAQGSDEEPRFIHLTYKPKDKAKKRVCLIGKGVTFDSGGLSLKPSAAMEAMKIDMSGAAAVLGAIGALAALGVPYEVHAFAACAENLPSGKAYKLGDVLRSMCGKTVEINNADAEGRLTLGDAITYAKTFEPDEIFDFATLTGACMVALGPHIAGVMSNDDALADRWLAAAAAAGEDMWRLPLPERLKEMLKSEVADMRNTGERYGGALTAGLFLKEFVGDTPWVHVDIAGPASADKEHGATGKGAVGFAVATICEYLSQ